MNLRYASVVLLLSSLLIAGLMWRSASGPNTTPEPDERYKVLVVLPVHKAILDDIVDASDFNVVSVYEPGADIHHLSLKPSQIRRMKNADKGLLYTPKMMEVEDTVRMMNAMTAAGVNLISMGNGYSNDPHDWLGVDGLRHYVEWATAAINSKEDSDTRRFGAFFLRRQAIWIEEQQDRFASINNAPFIVDHDAFTGFENDLGLTGKLGALTSGHDQAIGAKSLQALRAKALDKTVCVLHSPQANTQRIATLLQGAQPVFTQADPLLWNDESYANGMQRLADAFYACLSKAALAKAAR